MTKNQESFEDDRNTVTYQELLEEEMQLFLIISISDMSKRV